MLILLCCVWGSTWPIMKIALDEIPPFSMRTASTALGAMTLWVICLATRRSVHVPDGKAWGHIVVASLLNIVAFSLLSAFAQVAAATSRVAILAYTMPVWSVMLAWIFLRERPTATQLVSLTLCAAGLTVLIYPLATHGVPLGLLLALGIGLSWSAGTVYLKWALIKTDPMAAAMWQMAIAFLIIAASTVLFDGGFHFGAASARALWAMIVVGIAGNGIAYALWFTIVPKVSAVSASLGVLGSPVIGVVSSVLILGERPTGTDIIGFALILAACACVTLVPQRAARATEQQPTPTT
jgi:drug/metabolite transporter (DMT)-like permease